MTRALLVVWVGLLLGPGCSNPPSYREARASLGDFGLVHDPQREPTPGGTPASQPVSEAQIQAQVRRHVRGGQPVRLTILELADHANDQVARSIDDADLTAFRQRLGSASPLGVVETPPEQRLPNDLSLASLRHCAARAGAGRLLVLTRARERYDYNNGWSNLYPTLVGWLIAPGNTLEIHSRLEAALFDVPTGQLLGVTSVRREDSVRLLPVARNRERMRALVLTNSSTLFTILADKTLEMAKRIK